MHGYAEVTTQRDLDELCRTAGNFIDAVLHEARLLDRTYVIPDDNRTACGDGFDLQLLFQTGVCDIEVILCRVQAFTWDAGVLEDGLLCSITETNGWPERDIQLGDIHCARLFYRTRVQSGQHAALGSELPSPDAVPATSLQPGWRQCSSCCNAWEERDAIRFARCPKCHRVTDLMAQ